MISTTLLLDRWVAEDYSRVKVKSLFFRNKIREIRDRFKVKTIFLRNHHGLEFFYAFNKVCKNEWVAKVFFIYLWVRFGSPQKKV